MHRPPGRRLWVTPPPKCRREPPAPSLVLRSWEGGARVSAATGTGVATVGSMLVEHVEAPPTTSRRRCGSPILWCRHDRGWVALDPDPVVNGPIIVFDSGRAHDLRPEHWDQVSDHRYREHITTCGMPGVTGIGKAIEQFLTGDSRGSRRSTAADRPDQARRHPDAPRPRYLCDSCGESIMWGLSLSDGRLVPLDLDPHPEGRLMFVAPSDGRSNRVVPLSRAADGIWGYRNHHVTCSSAASDAQPRRSRRRLDRYSTT